MKTTMTIRLELDHATGTPEEVKAAVLRGLTAEIWSPTMPAPIAILGDGTEVFLDADAKLVD